MGVVYLTTPHPITDIVRGLVLEYIPGISLAKLKPSIDVSEQAAERISSQVMEALRAIEAKDCVLHNDIHIGNVVLRDQSCSLFIIDFGQADIREPELSDEEWSSVVRGSPDTLHEEASGDRPWKQIVMSYEIIRCWTRTIRILWCSTNTLKACLKTSVW
ncbi:hypothetical protein ARMSODRAFT_1025474 [Armillaria solidipes]|uniref:Protein kinase domain-containing protein n=1 Tax=Armillaria solidipes TaxID=1076256 RepID=A0A2H3AW35_9AGAR|nr:hypothetical protein ARMSODRAFT_1025474 [Armillaria solidipes]